MINLMGPTAVGKTALAVELARRLNTEIISADSRQVYREMHIGTAVPDDDERQGIPHHLLQHRSVHRPYTVKDFEREALEVLQKLFPNHPAVIMTGGTGLYFRAVNEGLDEMPDVPANIRAELEQTLQNQGLPALLDELRQSDPVYYAQVDRQNPRRIIRALEVIRYTGRPFSAFRTGKPALRPFRSLWIGLEAPRSLLYRRIEQRTDRMIARGLEDEVRRLYPLRHLPALQTVGYREWFPYFEGRTTRQQVIAEIKKNTRRYAKRQLTWFRRNPHIRWWDITGYTARELTDEVMTYIRQHL